MAAIATITVPDAAGTPVNHDFKPLKIDGDTASYVEQSASSSNGYWPLTVTQRAPLTGQKDRVFRTKINLAMPRVVDETINGVSRSTTLDTLRASVEFIVPEGATLQNRKDLRKLLVGILNDAQVKDNIENQINTF